MTTTAIVSGAYSGSDMSKALKTPKVVMAPTTRAAVSPTAIKEWNPLMPDVVEEKYYADGVGLILEVGVKGGNERVELLDYQSCKLANAGHCPPGRQNPQPTLGPLLA